MDNETRRRRIQAILTEATGPVTATALSREFGVSRQTIVGDVALLRAAGEPIIPTARGYQYDLPGAANMTVVVRHFPDDALREMNLIVSAGAVIDNVEIEHPLYGLLKGELHLESASDVAAFDQKRRELGGHLLSELTDGVHTHQLSAASPEILTAVREQLKDAGFLYE